MYFKDKILLKDIESSQPNKLNSEDFKKDKYIQVHNLLKSFLANGNHPCLGAKSVMNTSTYDFEIFDQLGDEKSSNVMVKSLYAFLKKIPKNSYPKLYSFFAVFEINNCSTEVEFENKLWKHLAYAHKYDKNFYKWDSRVSSNPKDTNFSFSIGGKAFYIVGMHPKSSRKARRFPMIMLVFNLHEQFELLRAKGKYNKLKESIRNRDKKLNGSINPLMNDFGSDSEVKQYSGRNVDNNWECPFSTKK